jgi:heavy metal efflux system protein
MPFTKSGRTQHRILPVGVKVVPMLDRSDLLHFTLHTVMHNLAKA